MSIVTKFGTANISNDGYYRITSYKEGNNTKLLHRLIWEDFYGCKIPKGFIIHHKNGNKSDNCILNLQLMRLSLHQSLHNIGKTISMETRRKISKKNSGDKHGLYGKHHSVESRKKISKSLNGKRLSEKTKKKISDVRKGVKQDINHKINSSKSKNSTGYFRVTKAIRKDCKQGFTWIYTYYENDKCKTISSVDIDKLKQKVLDKGLDWVEFNGVMGYEQ